MPCWNTRTTTVDMSRADLDILSKSLTADGWTVRIDAAALTAYRNADGASLTLRGGKLEARGREGLDLVGPVKRSYTTQAFKVAAMRAGYTVGRDARGRLTAERRRY